MGWFKVVGQIFPARTSGRRKTTKKAAYPAWWPLTVQALCHSSFTFDYPWLGENNERLEFLGDSVLQLLLSEIFFTRYPAATEGDLSHWRAAAVNARVWEKMAHLLALDTYLLVGKSNQEQISQNMLADAWEAFWGVAYLHLAWPKLQQGFGRALAQFKKVYGQDFLAYAMTYIDAKSRLQESLMQKKLPLPKYTCQVLANQQLEIGLTWQDQELKCMATSRKAGEALLAQQLFTQLGLGQTRPTNQAKEENTKRERK